jgi:hypothetical protein
LEIVLDLRAIEYDSKVGPVVTLPARRLIWQESLIQKQACLQNNTTRYLFKSN